MWITIRVPRLSQSRRFSEPMESAWEREEGEREERGRERGRGREEEEEEDY